MISLQYGLICDKCISIFSFSNADIIIGGMNSFIIYSIDFEPLFPHIWNDVVLCFKNPKMLPRWQYVYLVFDSNSAGILWFYTTFTISLLILIIFCFSGLEKKSMDIFFCFIYSAAVLLATPVKFQRYATRTTSQIFFSAFLCVSIVILAIYTSLFMNLMLNPKYEHKIQTNNESIGLGYLIVSPLEELVRSTS